MQYCLRTCMHCYMTAERHCEADCDIQKMNVKHIVVITGTSQPSEWSCIVTNIIGESCHSKQ